MRWLGWVVLAVASLAAAARCWTTRTTPTPAAPPRWPPFDPPPSAAGAMQAMASRPVEPSEVVPRWVVPVDGQCPIEHPVKANDNSGIFHVPGGRFYERTRAERCYVDAESAAADGYRAAKA